MLNLTNATPDLTYGTTGPVTARIMIVGEAWGYEEDQAKKPFVGSSGKELDRLLVEAGIKRTQCFATNVVAARPERNEMWRFFEARASKTEATWGLHPTRETYRHLSRLAEQIHLVKPALILAVGNYALWALTDSARIKYVGEHGRMVPAGIGDFRGSMLWTRDYPREKIPVLPIIHPASIMRDWTQRDVTKHDLLVRVPMALANEWYDKWNVALVGKPYATQLRDYFHSILDRLNSGEKVWLANDIETKRGLITCMSFAHEIRRGITLPLIKLDEKGNFLPYWDRRTEAELMLLALTVLRHPNTILVGQNYVYDTQYFQDHYGVTLYPGFDTMVMHHLLFPGTPKGLGYLSSLYCRFHRYWKDDNKEWHDKMDTDRHYIYNAEDSVRTLEIAFVLRDAIDAAGKADLALRETAKVRLSINMTKRGVLVDQKRKERLAFELLEASEARKAILLRVVPQSMVNAFFEKPPKSSWVTSPAQQQLVFYHILELKAQYHAKSKKLTLDKKALKVLRDTNPWLRRFFNLLLELRSIGVFQSHFVRPALDHDGRWRCTFNPAGTDTFRWSSSENSLGRGTNLQNIPKGDEK